MSQGKLGVAEIQEREAVPQLVKKSQPRFSLLAGVIVLVALGAIGIAVRSSRTHPVQAHSDKAAEMTVTVVHPQKASITIPALPGQTEAYTNAPIYAQTSGYLKKWYFDIGTKVKPMMFLPRSTLPKSIRSWHKRRLNSR